jgi:hypothetical protein
MKLCLLALLLGAAAAPAFAQTTLADWTFETVAPTTSGPYAADVGSGTATGFHALTSTYSATAGNGSFNAWSSNNWSVGDYYQFQVSTTGQSGLSLSWDETSSNTGPKDFALEYSTNGGASFTTVGSSYSVLANASPNPTWTNSTYHSIYTMTEDLSGITALNNDASVLFRLVDVDTTSANGGTVASTGTDRVDNFSLIAIPEPSTYALIAGLAVAAAALARRRLRAA